MSFLPETGFGIFILVMFAGIYLGLFGLPGAVIVFLDVFIYALITGFTQVQWNVLLVLLILAMAAESVDFWADSKHLYKAPATRQSLLGAAVGAAIGMGILTPILWGLGIWAGFFLGGLSGLLLLEWRRQSRLKSPQQVSGKSLLAMIGLRTVKGSLTLIMIFVSLVNIYS